MKENRRQITDYRSFAEAGELKPTLQIVAYALLLLQLCGCGGLAGYSNDSLFPDDIQSVYVMMFDNQTFYRGYEFELTDALAKRIESQSPYKIVSSSDRADSVISGQIVGIGESALSIERETGRILEKEVQIQAVVNWKNLNTGQMLINNVTVSSAASYTDFQSQDFLYASNLTTNNLARKIVELMEKKW